MEFRRIRLRTFFLPGRSLFPFPDAMPVSIQTRREARAPWRALRGDQQLAGGPALFEGAVVHRLELIQHSEMSPLAASGFMACSDTASRGSALNTEA